MTTIKAYQNPYYQELYGDKNSAMYGLPSISDDAASIMATGSVQNLADVSSSGSSDGADDGKIGFFSKVGSFFKGIGKTVKNAVKNLFTPKGFLKTALAVGLCCIPGIGPVIGMGMLAYGAVKGVKTVAQGAVAAHNATSDAEAKAAWENIGSGTFQVAASVAPMKGLHGAIKANGGYMASVSKGINTVGSGISSLRASIKTNGLTKTATNGLNSAKTSLSAAKESAKLSLENAKSQYNLSRATGRTFTEAAGDVLKNTNAYRTFNYSKNYGSTGNSTLAALKDTFVNSKAYTSYAGAAAKAGYASTASSLTPAIANLLEAANSGDEMAQKQLEALGYYVY